MRSQGGRAVSTNIDIVHGLHATGLKIEPNDFKGESFGVDLSRLVFCQWCLSKARHFIFL